MARWWAGALVAVSAISACSAGPAAPTRTAPATAVHAAATASGSIPRLSLASSGAGPGPILRGPPDRRAVALTFDSNMTELMLRELDDGRVASFDNLAVIDELDREHVPATFFLAGLWMQRYPDTVRRLAADPLFELGSHSYAHLGFTGGCYHLGRIPLSAMAADVERNETLLRSFDPRATRLFRFPGGCYDRDALRAIAPTGVTVVQYDVASGDAFGTSVPAIVREVLSDVRNGSIIVMHITGGDTAPLTAIALPSIVAGLRARGFQLETVTQLLDKVPPTPVDQHRPNPLPPALLPPVDARRPRHAVGVFHIAAAPSGS